MSSFAKEDWFEVTEDNIRDIRKRSFYGKDGLEVGCQIKAESFYCSSNL